MELVDVNDRKTRSKFTKLAPHLQVSLLAKQREVLDLEVLSDGQYSEDGIPYEVFITALQSVRVPHVPPDTPSHRY